MPAPEMGELQSVLIGATRCLDCTDPKCVNMCPEHVDVRAAMRLILGRGTRAQAAVSFGKSDEGTTGAIDAIEASFGEFSE